MCGGGGGGEGANIIALLSVTKFNTSVYYIVLAMEMNYKAFGNCHQWIEWYYCISHSQLTLFQSSIENSAAFSGLYTADSFFLSTLDTF